MADRELKVIFTGQDKTGQAVDGLSQKLGNLGKSITNVGKTMTVGLTAPLVGLGAVAVNAASDLDESINKVNVVFGEASKEVNDFAMNAATALGQSRQQALEAAGTFGNLLTSIGLAQGAAADMSTSMVTLASDVASFNNASPEETLLALRSALTGEFEPLKRFGVALNAAAVESKALQLGLAASKDEITPAIKAQATYALILEQTTNAQGDFARTADGLANSTRIAKAQFQDAAAALGQQLLPIALQVVQFLNKMLERFSNLSPEMQKTVLIFGAIAAAIGPVLIVVGQLITAFGAISGVVSAVVGVISGPLLIAIGAIVAVIAILVAAWRNNWGDIQGKTKAAVDFIVNLVQQFLELITQFWNEHGEQIKATVRIIWNTISNITEVVFTRVINLISAGLQRIAQFWDQHGEKIIAFVRAMWDLIVGIFEVARDNLRDLIAAFHLAQEGDWEGFGAKLREIWDRTWQAIKTILSNAWNAIIGIVRNMIASIINAFRNTDWASVGRGIIQGIIDGVKAMASRLASAATNTAKAAVGAVKGFLGSDSPSRVFMEIGQDMMSGLEMGFSATEQIVSGFNSTLTGLTKSLAIPNVSNQMSAGVNRSVSNISNVSAPATMNFDVTITDAESARVFLAEARRLRFDRLNASM